MNKLPRVTLLFWIMKIAATTLGETAGDLVSMTLKVGYAVSSLVLMGLFFVSLVTQLRSKQYHPARSLGYLRIGWRSNTAIHL